MTQNLARITFAVGLVAVAKLLEHRGHLRQALGVVTGGDADARALHRLREPVEIERLQHIVHSVEIEGPCRVAGIGGDEDHLRAVRALQLLGKIEARGVGHANVQQDKIGRRRTDQVARLLAVLGRAHHAHAGNALQADLEAAQRQRFVVGDQGAQGSGHW